MISKELRKHLCYLYLAVSPALPSIVGYAPSPSLLFVALFSAQIAAISWLYVQDLRAEIHTRVWPVRLFSPVRGFAQLDKAHEDVRQSFVDQIGRESEFQELIITKDLANHLWPEGPPKLYRGCRLTVLSEDGFCYLAVGSYKTCKECSE